LKLKPYLAVLAAGVGLTVASAPAAAFSGDEAIRDSAKFRLNTETLEPGCFLARGMSSDHIDLKYLSEGEVAKELHIKVKPQAWFSVDQVLVPSRLDGYAVYNGNFSTGHPGTDPDIDPDQTAVDMFAPGNGPIDKGDIVVCVSDHNDSALNTPYVTDVVPGEVAAVDRPIIQPVISCLGVSAIEPLHTYKIGFGYDTVRWYEPFAEFPFITDPEEFADHVLIKYRADQPGVRRVNDIDEYGEAYSDPHGEKANYGQPVVFHMNGDPEAYLHKSLPGTIDGGWPASFLEAFADQTSALGLFTFTAQGDLPVSWTLKASLAPDSYRKSVTLTLADLTAWENGTGGPAVPLCPGTNGPEMTPAPPAPPAAPATPGTNTTTIIERTTVQTVAGQTVVKQAKKKASKKAACMRKAKAKKSAKAKKKAMRKCRRMK
jgi:hypothetical protein